MVRMIPILAAVSLVACGEPLNVFTVQDDIELGEQLVDEILANPAEYPVVDAAEYPDAYGHLERLVLAILDNADVDHRDDFEWEFWLIDDNETLNAFAAPGGKVFVYTGIMRF